jgi:16S rRNA (cytosine1402-N4)-methyltransferase
MSEPGPTIFGHIPVLLAQVVTGLAPQPGELYADCTAGLGGHAMAVAHQQVLAAGGAVAPGRCVLNDFDPGNLARASAAVAEVLGAAAVTGVRGNFAALPAELTRRRMPADMVLADLGFASNQIDDPARGMSFLRDGPLDMRLDPNGPITAADLVNRASEQELKQLLYDFGEERDAGRIVRAIVAARAQGRITTTTQLAEVIRAAMPPSFKLVTGNDPSTRTFQALRIAVNDELGNLDALLDSVVDGAKAAAAGEPTWLAKGARVGIISFHSLEDRAVKRAFAKVVKAGWGTDRRGDVVQADDTERHENPRSRSAKLRVLTLSKS